MDIKITIDAETEAELKSIFSDISPSTLEKIIEDFSMLSTKILFYWITGKKRYRSLTEQYIEWVEMIYINLLHKDTKPTYDVLYNNFNMSPGQATYISRVLLEKTLSHWRQMAITELKKVTGEEYKKAKKLIEKGDTEVNIDITISALAANELKRISDKLRSKDDKFELPVSKGGYSTFKTFSIPVETIQTLNTELNG